MKLILPIGSILLFVAGCGGEHAGSGSPNSDDDAAGGGEGGAGGTASTGGSGGSGADGGGGAGGGMTGTGGSNRADSGTPDAGSTAAVCTSQAFWTNGDRGSQSMHPGDACITCHAMNPKAPKFAVAGTVYPTAHEPNDCNGAKATANVTVVVTDATGNQLAPIAVNSVGNFYYAGTIASPFNVKVVSNGKESAMKDAPPIGDCNSCHTQQGANGAPGRIMLP